ncbi:MAG: ATP-binding cassette domain-containing protein, partial [Gammaproteobacteria bacterium]
MPLAGSSMSAAVEISAVSKRFGEIEALSTVDATIERGRLTGLVGPDGAGKTTLLRMLTGL